MKDTFLKWLAFTLFLGLCALYSCNEEQWVDYRMEQRKSKHRNEELTIAKAQQWYEAHYAPVVTARSSFMDAGNTVKMKPGWDKAKESNRKRYEVVEVPIMTQKPHLLMDAETQRRWNSDVPEKFIRNTAKIVIERDKKTGRTRSFVMIFVGSYDYLKNTRSMGKNSYLYRQPDFDGMVLFYELNGSLVNGWKYTNGKITASIAPKIVLDGEEESSDIHSRGWVEECYTDYIYNTYQECDDDVSVSYDQEYGDIVVTSPSCRTVGYYDTVERCQTYWGDDEEEETDEENWWEEDNPIGGSNTSGESDDNGGNEEETEPQSCKTLEQVQKYIPERLKQAGITLDGINILYSTENCITNAIARNGNIYVCDNFFNLDIRDQTSIIYHVKNDIGVGTDWNSTVIRFDEKYYLEVPPEDIMAGLRSIYEEEYAFMVNIYSSIDEYIRECELSSYTIIHPDYYQNEIRAYESEIFYFNDVTASYDSERKAILWLNKQRYEVAVETYKNQ